MTLYQKVAIAETLLAAGLLYNIKKTPTKLGKATCGLAAAYLAYGAYLNTQERIVLLPEKKK